MPMNNRLLRPRQTIHPESADWANRVRTNGGSVSGTTLTAVDRFVKAIHAAGIRDRFYRLNLFCGNSDASLAAVRTPLYRGPSLTGTQYGNATDTNVNFVQGDYAETGASGGLNGLRTSSKWLNTGVGGSAFNGHNFHASAYERVNSDSTYDVSAGVRRFSPEAGFSIGTGNATTTYTFSQVNNGISSTGGALPGHFIGVQTGNRVGALYRNGSVISSSYEGGANTPSDWSALSYGVAIFALQTSAGVASDFSSARLGGYSFGLAMTAAQAAAYYTAMQSFQTALGRQV